MIDAISHQRLQLLHPKLRDEAIRIIDVANTKLLVGKARVRVTSTLRTFQEQTALYNLGRSVRNPDGITPNKPLGQIVTNAKAGQSNHNYGLSLDFTLIVDTNNDGVYDFTSWETTKDYDLDKVADWMEVVSVFKNNGWEWGGSWKTFKDLPHVQKTFGLSVTDCYNKYIKKDFIPGTQYIRI
jgi:peptidoglycan L-alanyl-D-glutamate endopeptidase CwlK